MWSTDGTVWNRAPDPTSESDRGKAGRVVDGDRLRPWGCCCHRRRVSGSRRLGIPGGSEWHALDAEFLDESASIHVVVDDLVWDSDRLVAVGGYQVTTPGFGWAPIRCHLHFRGGGTTWHMGSEVDVASARPGSVTPRCPAQPESPHSDHRSWSSETTPSQPPGHQRVHPARQERRCMAGGCGVGGTVRRLHDATFLDYDSLARDNDGGCHRRAGGSEAG